MLFAGDDWAQDHHDVEIVDDQGRRLVRRRLPEGVEGIAGLHALIAASAPGEWADLDPAEAASQVKVGIETDRGPWVQALIAAGYEVFAFTHVSFPVPGTALHVSKPDPGCSCPGRDGEAGPGPSPAGGRCSELGGRSR